MIGEEVSRFDSKKISRPRKGEVEEHGEGVAKRLEPNWNST